MWQNYSQWLLDARSRFEQASSVSRAKQAAAGFRVSGATSGEKKALQEFTESERGLRSGYTYETLASARAPVGAFGVRRRKTEESMQLLSGPDDIAVQMIPEVLSRDDYEQGRTAGLRPVSLLTQFNITKEQYAQQFNRFVKLFGRNPDTNEMFYTLKYGLPSQSSTAPSEDERSRIKAEQAAGRAASDQKAALRIGAEEDESKSPWV